MITQDVTDTIQLLRNMADHTDVRVDTPYGRTILRQASNLMEKLLAGGDHDRLPCRIGDTVWVAASYRGVWKAKPGKVREMYYDDDMGLMISAFHLRRGRWGVEIFRTEREAQAAADRRNNG